MKISKKIYIAAGLLSLSWAGMAQNVYYSQFHHAATLTNPAAVATKNEMSVMLNYRRQWAGVGDGYSTPAISFSRALLKGNDADKRFGGVSVTILQDRTGQTAMYKPQAEQWVTRITCV